MKLAHSGSVFEVSPQSLRDWRGWWRIVRFDQWGVYFTGAMLGMILPAILYTSALEPGRDIRGLGVAAELAGVEVWLVDCLRDRPHPTHAHLERALEWIARIAPRRAFLTNLHVDMDYAELDRLTPAHVQPCHDGLVIEVNGE